MSSKLTQKLTYSDFDHVAMVLTFVDDDDIYLLDATTEGVHIRSWSDIRKYKDECYSKIVWRKLYADRDDLFWEILQTFVEAVQGKKYKITISKLLKKKSIMPRLSQVLSGENVVDDDRTFFCSELIAKAYKTLGFLISERSSAKFYPKHFSSKKDLQLTNAILGEELIISNN